VDSLLNARRVFQIDANFGGVAAVAEMLLQSHGGVIRVLPALPQAWPEGHFQGFRARGGFSLDVRWVEGAVRFIRLHSKLGEPCHLQFAGAEAARVTRAGEVVPVEQTGHNLRLGTMAGATYEIQVLVADDLTPESLGD
jgi:alpha-L-fucosidase 2